jgi:hypothetical protein
MKLIVVDSLQLIKTFHKVPAIIYRNDKNYIPHIRQDIEKLFDPNKNKLFKQGGKAIRWVLYDKNNALIGRVAAFINPKTKNSSLNKIPTGGMGFFECIDHQEAADLLFNACKEWLSSLGMESMDGPINFGERNEFWGLLIENFESPSSYQMNYNPPYYRALFEHYGFQLYFNQIVYWRDMYDGLSEKFMESYKRINNDSDYEIRNIRGMKLDQVARDFQEVYNGAWATHVGFKTLKLQVAQNIIKALKPIIDRDIILFTYHKGRPVAFYVNIPELNDIFKYVNGNLNLWGKLVFLFRKHFAKRTTMVGIVFGVIKAYQGKGIDTAMIQWARLYLVPLDKYKYTILTWIGDFNPKMMMVAKGLGGEEWRKLATYKYNFDASIPFERHPVFS